MNSKICAVCEQEIQVTEEAHEVERADQPTFMHPICYWKATAGMLTAQLAKIEMTIENGNKTVAILARCLIDLLPCTEVGFPMTVLTPEKRQRLIITLKKAKEITQQFEREDRGAHICTKECKHQ